MGSDIEQRYLNELNDLKADLQRKIYEYKEEMKEIYKQIQIIDRKINTVNYSMDEPLKPSVNDAILMLLSTSDMTLSELALGIDKPKNSLSTALSKLKSKGKVENDKGTWKLKQ